jgi:phosphoglycolate phosphatase
MTPAIVFDLDGTLVDTAPDLIAALNHVLDGIGRPILGVDRVRQVVGQGAAAMIERGMRLSGSGPIAEQAPELLATFLAHYGANLSSHSRPFDGVIACLDHFKALGHRLAVCTNKPENLSRRLLADLALDHYFDAVLGGDTLAVRKPDPTHLIETIRRAGGDSAYAIMVGDSEPDVKAAKAAQVPVIAVSFGYSQVGPHDLGADVVIDHYRDLPHAVARLLERA